MEKILFSCIITLSILTIFSSGVFAQSLYIDKDELEMEKIQNSKYIASNISIIRNSSGELISVVKTEASTYLPKSITDKFLDTLPEMKKGSMNGKNVSMMQTIVEYQYEECLGEIFQVPGYDKQCDWYHRPYITNLAVNDETGERYEIFRGLNHSYLVKPSYSVTDYWTIIRTD